MPKRDGKGKLCKVLRIGSIENEKSAMMGFNLGSYKFLSIIIDFGFFILS